MKPATPTQHFYHVRDFQPSTVPPFIYDLVLRQAQSWEQNNFDLAKDDWHPEGVLVSPAGEWEASKLAKAMRDFHQNFMDLQVTIKNIIASPNQDKLAVEWDWTVTRRTDGLRGTTPDAILAELQDGKIISWREYFDLSQSVEAK